MLQFTDEAIILSSRKFSESSAILSFLSCEHGLYSGVVRGAYGKRLRGILEPGNHVQVTWKARLAEHMGSVTCELIESVAAYMLDSQLKLCALQASTVLVEQCITEREPHPNLYRDMQCLLQAMKYDQAWLVAYVQIELDLLTLSGFGLDLSYCADTGTHEDLVYVSPCSGRAVCRKSGGPYHDKLLPLPKFLLNDGNKDDVEMQQIIDGLRLTGYFLESRVFIPHGKTMPDVRKRFVKLAENQDAFSLKGEGEYKKEIA